MIPPSTPIYDALAALRAAGALRETDAQALTDGLPVLTAVRTLGDLQEVVRTKDLLNLPGMTEALYKRVKAVVTEK